MGAGTGINKRLLYLSIVVFMFMLAGGAVAHAADTGAELRRAAEFCQKGNYETAIRILAGALKKEPGNQKIISALTEAQRALDERTAREKEQKIAGEVDALNRQAQALYDKGELNGAVKLWSKILEIRPGDDNAAWQIQKAQARLQIEDGAPSEAELKERAYSKKIKDIADDIAKLMEEAKTKIRQEEEKRKEDELETLKRQAKLEEAARLQEKQRAQGKEEAFISDTFKKGQEFYSKKKYEEALREWESILPLLAKDNELRVTIESLKKEIASPLSRGPSPAAGPRNDDVAVVTTPEPVPAPKPEPSPQELKPAPPQITAVTPAPATAPAPPIVTKPDVGARHAWPLRIGSRIGLVFVILFLILCLFFISWRRDIFKKIIASTDKRLGKDFDPRKLRQFIEGKKNTAGGAGKDIFKVE
jgi:tetratricopeptide (TPR) repeat protein